ncbi:MAG: hypothetical protein LBR80_10775 [Deltaproteobacteria bacterium]|jgi:hypothetical protein|nr:hypothetical protein [Deltaproteobacteria bacterium]
MDAFPPKGPGDHGAESHFDTGNPGSQTIPDGPGDAACPAADDSGNAGESENAYAGLEKPDESATGFNGTSATATSGADNAEDDAYDANGTDQDGKGPVFGKIRLALLAAAVILVLLLIVAPTFLLRMALNRDLEPGSGWGRTSAEKVRVNPILTGFRVEGLSLFPEGSDAAALTVESVTGSGLNPLSVLSAIFGRGSFLAIISGKGQVTARGAVYDGAATGATLSGRLDTLSASGLSFAEAGGDLVESAELNVLRIGGLSLENEGGGYARLDGFSLAGLSGGVAGRISVSGLAMDNSRGATLELDGFTAGGVDLRTLFLPQRTNPAGLALSIFESLDSLDLDHLALASVGGETFYARSARLDTRTADAGTPRREIEISGIRLDLERIMEDELLTPEGRALAAAFGTAPSGSVNFAARGAPGPGVRLYDLRISVDGAMELAVVQNVSRFPSLASFAAGFPETALTLLGAQIAQGGIYYVDGGAAARLYPVLSETFFEGAPAGDALKELLLPLIRDLDPEWIVNLGPLEGEVALFLDDPVSVAFGWEPERGFPGSAAAKAGLFSGSGEIDPQDTAPFGYAMLEEMNLTISVNGRAPMGVVTARPRDGSGTPF